MKREETLREAGDLLVTAKNVAGEKDSCQITERRKRSRSNSPPDKQATTRRERARRRKG